MPSSQTLIAFSSGMAERSGELHRFLRKQLYEHPQVLEMTSNADLMVTAQFQGYFEDVSKMPADFAL